MKKVAREVTDAAAGERQRATALSTHLILARLGAERGHDLDMKDVGEMLDRGLVVHEKLLGLFERIEPALYRYPAIDPASYRRHVEDIARDS